MAELRGSCLCGDVTYTISGSLSHAVACHCSQCRKQSGHVWAVASAPRDAVMVSGAVSWYAASEHGDRGFCPRCGSFLFWRGVGGDTLEIGLGTLDGLTGLKLEGHIFAPDKGDYYDIADGLPQYDREAP